MEDPRQARFRRWRVGPLAKAIHMLELDAV
jgi:hypothetical protein